MSKRVVPKKNYYILIGLLIGVVILTFSIVSICNAVKNKNITSGYLNKYVSEISYKELDTYLLEPASDTFVYITYTGDENVYKLEKGLKKIINNNELADNFIYVDITEEMLDNNFINNLNQKINCNIEKLPVLLYYKDGVLTEQLESKKLLFSVADFQKMLDNYEITNS